VAPIRYLHDPVTVSRPHSVHHHPVYAPVYEPSHVYHVPTQNCSIIPEVTTVEVCTPSLQTTCMAMEMSVKSIMDKEECRSITRTVCAVMEQESETEICVYKYQDKTEEAMATNYEVTFEKECQNQMVSVCQPSVVAGYAKITNQYCKEVEQETCYNVPMVMPIQEMVMVSYPEPVMECMQKPITIPQVTCQDMREEKCFMVPEIMDDVMMVEKCEVSLGSPSCQVMEVSLPKQVCKELVFGEVEDKEEEKPKLESMMEMQQQP